jgi:trimethylamine--corrinoid protein Co-methyltransferase
MRILGLNDEQIEKLHQASLRILSGIGVHIPHAEMLRLFQEAGAEVDPESERVKISESLVMQCLKQCGKTYTTYGREPSERAEFGVGKRNYNSIAGEALWIDDQTGERRYATLEDVAAASRLGDALDGLTIVGAMADPHEIPVSHRCVEVAATQLMHTTKPITFWFHDRASLAFVMELFSAVRGSEQEAARHPFTYLFLEPISPLRFPFDGIDLLFEASRLPLPVSIGPMAQVGMSAPGTLAGTIGQENAEILAGVCVTQLIRPGTPVCYGGIPHAFDMRTTQMIFAGPEQALMAMALTQMGKRYGLPVYINVGLTDSKCVDAQAGLEAGITLTCGALAGADVFGHLGIAGVDQAASLDMLVMQHEIIAFVERIMRGLEIDDDTLGLEVIEAVGPGGTFIDREHTAQHFRNELWFPKLLDRDFWSSWWEAGQKDMQSRCREMKEQLLAEHAPTPLADDVSREIDKIVIAARRHLTDQSGR